MYEQDSESDEAPGSILFENRPFVDETPLLPINNIQQQRQYDLSHLQTRREPPHRPGQLNYMPRPRIKNWKDVQNIDAFL